MRLTNLLLFLSALMFSVPGFAANPNLGSSETSNVKVCLDYQRSTEELLRFCELALASKDLDRKTRLQIHRLLGDALENSQRFEEAFVQYQKAAEIDPLDARPLRDLGWLFWKTEEYPKSIEAFEASIEIEADASAFAGLAASLKNMDAPIDRSLELLNRALLIRPDYTWALVERAWLFADSGRFEEAMSDFENAREIDPSLSDPHYGMAWLHNKTGDKEAALTAVNEALVYGPDYYVYLGFRAFLMRQAENYRASIADAAKALRQEPGYTYGAIQMALSQAELGFLNGALKTFRRASESGAAGNDFFYEYAYLLTEIGDWPDALQKIELALEHNSANEFDHNLRSFILLQLDRNVDALSSARKAQKIEPGFFSASLNACYANMNLGNDEAALEDIKRAKANGASVADVNDVIKYLVNQGKLETAQHFRSVLDDM